MKAMDRFELVTTFARGDEHRTLTLDGPRVSLVGSDARHEAEYDGPTIAIVVFEAIATRLGSEGFEASTAWSGALGPALAPFSAHHHAQGEREVVELDALIGHRLPQRLHSVDLSRADYGTAQRPFYEALLSRRAVLCSIDRICVRPPLRASLRRSLEDWPEVRMESAKPTEDRGDAAPELDPPEP